MYRYDMKNLRQQYEFITVYLDSNRTVLDAILIIIQKLHSSRIILILIFYVVMYITIII